MGEVLIRATLCETSLINPSGMKDFDDHSILLFVIHTLLSVTIKHFLEIILLFSNIYEAFTYE